jgi:hypothetical protein
MWHEGFLDCVLINSRVYHDQNNAQQKLGTIQPKQTRSKSGLQAFADCANRGKIADGR